MSTTVIRRSLLMHSRRTHTHTHKERDSHFLLRRNVDVFDELVAVAIAEKTHSSAVCVCDHSDQFPPSKTTQIATNTTFVRARKRIACIDSVARMPTAGRSTVLRHYRIPNEIGATGRLAECDCVTRVCVCVRHHSDAINTNGNEMKTI